MMDWNTLISAKRFGLEEFHKERHENRSEFQRDYDRLIFSAPFRRLQNKKMCIRDRTYDAAELAHRLGEARKRMAESPVHPYGRERQDLRFGNCLLYTSRCV